MLINPESVHCFPGKPNSGGLGDVSKETLTKSKKSIQNRLTQIKDQGSVFEHILQNPVLKEPKTSGKNKNLTSAVLKKSLYIVLMYQKI